MVIIAFIVGFILGALFGGASIVVFFLAVGAAIPSAIGTAILGPLVGIALAVAPPIGLLLAPLLAVVGTGMLQALIVLLIWLVFGTLITAIPYFFAAITVYGPSGPRSGLIPESPVSYTMRGAMTGFSLGANAVILAFIAAACIGVAIATGFSSLLISLLAIAAIIAGAVAHILSLIPMMSPVPWVRTLIGYSGWFMPMTWPAQALGLFYLALTLIGRIFGAAFRFRMDWSHGVPAFYGGWVNAIQVGLMDLILGPGQGAGWGGVGPGNFVFANIAHWRSPPPIERADFSRISIARHETGHCLHTSVLGTFFSILDVIEETIWPAVSERAYGEIIAESLIRRSPVYWSGDRSVMPIPWIGVWGTAMNLIPEARFSGPVNGTVGVPMVYSGTASFDPDSSPNIPLGFRWALYGQDARSRFALGLNDALPPNVFDLPGQPTVTFTPDSAGRFALELRVHDGAASSYPARMCVGVDVPIASITGPNTAQIGSAVTLDGSGSVDPTGGVLDEFGWDLVAAPEGSRSVMTPAGADDLQMSFTPDLPGRYVARLEVTNDSDQISCPVVFSLLAECTSAATAPTAVIAPLAQTFINTPVILDGSGSSDPGGANLSFDWTLLESPPASATVISDTTASTPALTPDMPGRYLVRLTVNNGTATSCPAFATLVVFCPPPELGFLVRRSGGLTVRATGTTPDPLILTASPPVDDAGTPMMITWTLTSVPAGSVFSTPMTLTGPQFNINPDVAGKYFVTAVATDVSGTVRASGGWCEDVGILSPLPPRATFDVRDSVLRRRDFANNEPRVDEVHFGARVFLNARFVTRRDNEPNTYVWRFEQTPAGSSTTLNAPDSIERGGAVFEPDALGRYVVSLRVGSARGFTCAELRVFDVVDR